MPFEPSAATRRALRRELPRFRLQPGERLLWLGEATWGHRKGLLACTSRKVQWLRLRLVGSGRRSWDVSLVQAVGVHGAAPGRAQVAMQARTSLRPYRFGLSLPAGKAFAAALRKACAQEALARLADEEIPRPPARRLRKSAIRRMARRMGKPTAKAAPMWIAA